jgi:hypothetical protein
MNTFVPNLAILPPAQQRLWPELAATPDDFVLYGGTALALRLGHRSSVDFDFFSNEPFNPDELARNVSFLDGVERLQSTTNTLTCMIERDGPVQISFFGGLSLGRIIEPDQAEDVAVNVASLLDIAGTKVVVAQSRAQAKDYIDIDALIGNGIDLAIALAAGFAVYGPKFNPVLTLKALTFYADVPDVPETMRKRLTKAVHAVDLDKLPTLEPILKPRQRS